MPKKKKILLIYTHNNTFVKTDREILSSEFEVVNYRFRMGGNSMFVIASVIWQFFFLIFTGFRYRYFYIWFAGYHSILPVLFGKLVGKKVFLVAGGYDIERYRKYNYGAFIGRFRTAVTFKSFVHANKILAVSEYVARKLRYITKRKDVLVFYNALNISPSASSESNSTQVLTVGNIYNKTRFFIKGIDSFAQLAECCATYDFVLVGAKHNDIRNWHGKPLPKNLFIIEKQKHTQLSSYYCNAKIYCQLSRCESFGMSVAEAMYFGCKVITTKAGGLPEVTAEFGIFPGSDLRAWAAAINTFKEIEVLDKSEMKNSVIQRFGFEVRKKNILRLLTPILR